LIQKYINNEFDASLTKQLALLLGNRSEVINKVYQAQGKQFLASIVEMIATIDHPSINSVHEENIRLFLEPFLTLDEVKRKGISFCGSYAWGRKAQVIKILEECNINRFKFVKEPIVELAEYTLKSTV